MIDSICNEFGHSDGINAMPCDEATCARQCKPRLGIDEFMAFAETIPESILPHLSESQIIEEYWHHYGKP